MAQSPAGRSQTPQTKAPISDSLIHPALKGRIVDRETKAPIRFATISLLGKDSALIAGMQSGEDGGFVFSQVPVQSLIVRVSFVGYLSYYKAFPSGRKTLMNLGQISMATDAAQLQTIVVSAEKSAFKTEIDKKIFDVDKSLASKGGTAADALRQVPTLNVSATGKVSLRNGTPVILLDGKRTALSLDQIPSDQIQRIEVMPNPSARYDAQGNNGIVNIVMKKSRKPGVNGSVSGIWNSLGETYEFLNLNVYKNRLNFSLNIMGHHHYSAENTTTERTNLSDNTSFNQHGKNETMGPFHKFRMGLEFLMDKHNTFSLSSDIGFGTHPTTGNQFTEYRNASGLTDSGSLRGTYQGHAFTFSHITLDYSHEFKKENEKLTGSAALEAYYGPDKGHYNMQWLDKTGAAMSSLFLQQYEASIRAHSWTLQSDYTDPLRNGKARLEAGVKAIFHVDHNLNTLSDYDTVMHAWLVNRAVSYNYRYADNTYAVYGSYSDRYGSFSYMAGLRFEEYDYTGSIADSNISISFQNRGLYPSLFLTEKLAANTEFHVNYSRRVNRPDFGQISPKVDYSNPQNPQKGNPGLRPENTNLLELSYNTLLKSSSLAATLFVKNTLNPITAFSMPLSRDTLLNTFMNANSSNTYGAEFVVKIPILKWWNATTNLNMFQTAINADNLSQGLSHSGFSWFAKLNSDMKISDRCSFQLTGNYSGAEIMAQGKTMPSGGMDAAVKRDLLKNKAATLVVSLSDIFNTQRERIRTWSDNIFFQDALSKPLTRVLKVNFTYTFGKEKSKPA